jgi:tetratricopeptide (TPR) repeat protein
VAAVSIRSANSRDRRGSLTAFRPPRRFAASMNWTRVDSRESKLVVQRTLSVRVTPHTMKSMSHLCRRSVIARTRSPSLNSLPEFCDTRRVTAEMVRSVLVRCALALVLGSILVGCGHARLVCGRLGGPEWRQYESRHFAVTTDLPPSQARSLLGGFERTYRSFLDVTGWHFPGRGEPPGRMRVIVFARRRDYEAVAPPRTDGFYRSESLESDAAVVIDNDGTHPPGEVFLHELTHRLLRYYVPNVPLALNEGLAEYYSTFVVRDGAALTGLPPEQRLAATVSWTSGDAPRVWLPSVRWLLHLDTLQGLSPQQVHFFYVGGWFLVHTMARFYPYQLGDALARMADGESFATAFVASLGPDAWTNLEAYYRKAVLDAYQSRPGSFVVPSWRKPYQAPAIVDSVERESPLGETGLHLLWADLLQRRGDVAGQVALAQAHGADSAQLSYMRALLHLQRHELAEAERELTAAIDARPDEERYRLTLARVHALALEHQPQQALAAMAEQMSWLATHAQAPQSIALVAVYDALRGDVAAARMQVQRALAIDPTSAAAYYAIAIVAVAERDIDGAMAAAERSLHLTPEGASGTAAKALLDKLRELRAGRLGGGFRPPS